MKRLQQNAKIILLLLCGSMLASHSDAWPKLFRHGSKQLAATETASPSYSLKQAKGKITVTDGTRETLISGNPNDVQPVLNGNEVYYITKTATGKASGSSVLVYNIASGTKEDIIKQNAAAANYNTKSEIENILVDKTTNRIFFSSSLKNDKGQDEKLTWKYDINSKQLEVYKDGSIESIDNAGNQVIIFRGEDSKGAYTMRTLCGSDGKIQHVIGKQYDLISKNK